MKRFYLIRNTNTNQNRIPNIKNFAASHDLILFVSGKKSSNCKLLYNECKKINPNTFLVGFKLVKHNKDNHLINEAEKLRKTNSCDAVFANKASDLSEKGHSGLLLYKGKVAARPVGKKEIAKAIVDLAFNTIN